MIQAIFLFYLFYYYKNREIVNSILLFKSLNLKMKIKAGWRWSFWMKISIYENGVENGARLKLLLRVYINYHHFNEV